MGEVFLAHDTSLDRKVALKFPPDIFSGDPERLARFEREAKLLASLNHPNIAAIYGLEEAGGKRFLVLELVEGETLAQMIAKGTVLGTFQSRRSRRQKALRGRPLLSESHGKRELHFTFSGHWFNITKNPNPVKEAL
jgi:serine/threonine protein kinase